MAIPRSFKLTPGGLSAKVPTKFKDHKLLNCSPNKCQFEPTEASPVRQQAQMAGDPCGGTYGGKRR